MVNFSSMVFHSLYILLWSMLAFFMVVEYLFSLLMFIRMALLLVLG